MTPCICIPCCRSYRPPALAKAATLHPYKNTMCAMLRTQSAVNGMVGGGAQPSPLAELAHTGVIFCGEQTVLQISFRAQKTKLKVAP